jgi:hypothetical protein
MSDVPVLRTTGAGVSEALHEGARLRRIGTPFDVELLFPDDRSTIANLAARDIARVEPDPSRRLPALDALAAHDARIGDANLLELSTVPAPQRDAARDLVMLARDLRVTSWAQARRFTYGLSLPPNGALATPIDDAVPSPPSELRPPGVRLLVWAPRLRTQDMLIILAAACADGAPVDLVCAGGPDFGYAVTLIAPADAAHALQNAGVIIAADAEDASAAVSLSAWQRPLCATTTSGASMWLRGLTTFRPWSRPDLQRAISAARALPPPQATVFSAISGPPIPDAPCGSSLVRIIVRGDGDAPCAVTSDALKRLSYRSIEIVAATSDDAERQAGDAPGAAYVMLLDDGDAPFPESFDLLVGALERSAATRVRGDVLITYLVDAPGELHAVGYAIAGAHAHGVDADPHRGPHVLTRVRAHATAPTDDPDLEVRVNAVVGTTYRHITGALPFRPTAAPRPTRLPSLPLAARPLER